MAGSVSLVSSCLQNVPPDVVPPRDIPRPKIAEKPPSDRLAEAVDDAGGNVSGALANLGVFVDRNRDNEIEYIDLSNRALTARGLTFLRALKGSLRRLSLNNTYVTDEALEVLSRLPNLTKLQLNRTPVTDNGLRHLTNLRRLHELELRATRIGNGGLKSLGELSELRFLSLSFTNITDAGLAYLTRLDHLHTLLLEDTAITDDAFRHLRKLKNLAFLNLIGTQVTKSGVARFQQSAPRVQVRAAFSE